MPVWVMFLFAAQFVLVRFRDEEFSALQFAMLLMMATWQSLWAIMAVAIATSAYELVVLRKWYKAAFNVVAQTASYGLAYAVFHAVDWRLASEIGPWSVGVAVFLAGVTQELLMSAALWVPVRLTPMEWLKQEKYGLLSLGAGTVGTMATIVWPPMLLIGLMTVLSFPLAGSWRKALSTDSR